MNKEFIMLIVFFIIFLGLILLSIVLWSWYNGISPMPTAPRVKKALLTHLPHAIEGTIYDLGSGWGTLLVPLAKKYPECHIVGFETSPIPYLFSLLYIKAAGLTNVHVKRCNFFNSPLNDASLVVCYLYPEAMRKLKEKFLAELKQGTWVVSNTFAIPGWEPELTVTIPDLYLTKIYLYVTHH